MPRQRSLRASAHLLPVLLSLALGVRCARVSTPVPYDVAVRHGDAGADLPMRDRGTGEPMRDRGAGEGTAGDAARCDCPLGCDDAGCGEIVPSNGFTWGAVQTLDPLSGTYSINTTTCIGAYPTGGFLAGSIEGGACVFTLASLVVPLGSVLAATGERPLALLIRGGASVEGLVDVGAKRDVPGPGGGAPNTGMGAGGAGGCCAGGGGGGFGTGGGYSYGTAGSTYGNETLVPLVGGSGGGHGGQARGGAGGGALQISCAQTLRVDGRITAGGGGGSSGGSSGGGGAGGAVLLEALSIVGTGVVAANGAGGGGVGDLPGEDGDPTFTPAAGGTRAGAGATGATLAGVGASGGGGGGGLGRVRYNLARPTIVPLVTSAAFSLGTVQGSR